MLQEAGEGRVWHPSNQEPGALGLGYLVGLVQHLTVGIASSKFLDTLAALARHMTDQGSFKRDSICFFQVPSHRAEGRSSFWFM